MWGHGYATEMLRTAIGFAFDSVGLSRLEADIDPRNAASCRLVERVGFVREGLLRERWRVAGEVTEGRRVLVRRVRQHVQRDVGDTGRQLVAFRPDLPLEGRPQVIDRVDPARCEDLAEPVGVSRLRSVDRNRRPTRTRRPPVVSKPPTSRKLSRPSIAGITVFIASCS